MLWRAASVIATLTPMTNATALSDWQAPTIEAITDTGSTSDVVEPIVNAQPSSFPV